MENSYDDTVYMDGLVRDGKHREAIGGMWEEIGQLQLDFLKRQGLRPAHRLLDLGCGALRGGVKFIAYLEPSHYWGIDNSAALLEAGWEKELAPLGLQQRQPRAQLVCLSDFQFDTLGARFDFAIAQSVFTHMSLNRIRRCLARLAPHMESQGSLYATYFETDGPHARESDKVHVPGGIVTHSDRDPYHYDLDDFEFVIRDLPWRIERIGAWDHPRDQRMLRFTRT
jgi:cyclopropane fatty-acyl-phospholipid synthase-like methyltransferase